MSELAGDDLAKACAESMYARDIAAQNVGIIIDEVRAGFAQLSMSIRANMLNGHAICHGGLIFTLADTAFAYACNSRNRVSVAQHCHIEFKQPGKENERLTATAEQQSQDGRYGQYDVTVRNQEQAVIAVFQGQSCEIRGAVIQE